MHTFSGTTESYVTVQRSMNKTDLLTKFVFFFGLSSPTLQIQEEEKRMMVKRFAVIPKLGIHLCDGFFRGGRKSKSRHHPK